MLGWLQGVRSSKTKFSSKFKLIRWNSETAENFLVVELSIAKLLITQILLINLRKL